MNNFPTGHNNFFSLNNPTKEEFKVFVSMFKGLQTCPLAHAISADPEIHYFWIKQLWEIVEIHNKGSKITSRVNNVRVTVTEDVVRKALQIRDKADYPRTEEFTEQQLADHLYDIGYEKDGSTCE